MLSLKSIIKPDPATSLLQHVGEKGLPVEWLQQLEDGPRGRSFAKILADKLFETWWKVHQTPSA